MLRGEHQRNGTSPAASFVRLAGADLAGDDAGDELGSGQGSRSSGSLNQRDLRSVLSCYSIYASTWSCWCPRKDELIIGGPPATSGSGGPRRAPVKLELEEGIDGENLGEMTACSRGVQWWR